MSTTISWHRDVGGKRYRVNAVGVTASSTTTGPSGSARTVQTRITRFTLVPDMGKRNQIVLGYLYMAGEKLDIHGITLSKGRIMFNASCIASHPHTGDLVGVIITDTEGVQVWTDEEIITPCPSGINVGDTLQMDFELDPTGHGRTERWVRVK